MLNNDSDKNLTNTNCAGVGSIILSKTTNQIKRRIDNELFKAEPFVNDFALLMNLIDICNQSATFLILFF